MAARFDAELAPPEAMVGCMAMVPLLPALGADVRVARGLQDALLFQHRIECPAMARAGRLRLRLGVQAYVGGEDIHALKRALLHECGRAGQA